MPGHADTTIKQTQSSADPGNKDLDQQTWVDRFVIHVSNTTAWLFPILVIAITAQVALRKMGHNQAWLDDLQWWIYGFSMTVGFVYAITTQSHVRVDIFHSNFSEAKKSRIEIFALGWLLLPFLILMTDILSHYAWASIIAGEGSDSANGLHRLYLLKASLPIVFSLAVLASLSMLIRHLSVIATVRLWSVLLAAFPAAWFISERFCHYFLWWYVRLENPEIKPARIIKEPLLENAIWYGLVLVIAIVFISILNDRRKAHG